jgi:hypothetical protein
MTAFVVGLAVAVVLLAFLVAGLLRSNAEVIRILHGMGANLDPSSPGDPTQAAGDAPIALSARPTPERPAATDIIDLTGTTPTGDAVSLAVTGVRHDTLIGFLTSGCQTCRGFWDALRDGSTPVPGGARLVLVTRGSEAESPAAIANLAGPDLPVVMSTEAWEHYDIPYAPYFVYVSGPAGRVVGEGVAAGWEEVRKLVANAVADGTTSPPGHPTPPAQTAPGSRARSRADRARDDAVDRVLEAAGIRPGDPRLHPTSIDGDPPAP